MEGINRVGKDNGVRQGRNVPLLWRTAVRLSLTLPKIPKDT